MEKRSDDNSETSDFNFDPVNKVVGFIDDPNDASAALRELRAAGFTADEIVVLASEEGARLIAAATGEHKVLVRIFSSAQKPKYYDAPGLVRRIRRQVQSGHFGIGVSAGKPESRERVREILKSHHGHFINFYGVLAAEALEP